MGTEARFKWREKQVGGEKAMEGADNSSRKLDWEGVKGGREKPGGGGVLV